MNKQTKNQLKSERCQFVKNSIAANKDIIEDFGRAIKATAESRSKLLFNQSAKPYLASLKWNIGHMRSRIRNIKNMS